MSDNDFVECDIHKLRSVPCKACAEDQAKDAKIAELELAEQLRETGRGCPCLYTKPCMPRCSCASPTSSRGCARCCQYGNLEQRKARAEILVARETEREVAFETHADLVNKLGELQAQQAMHAKFWALPDAQLFREASDTRYESQCIGADGDYLCAVAPTPDEASAALGASGGEAMMNDVGGLAQALAYATQVEDELPHLIQPERSSYHVVALAKEVARLQKEAHRTPTENITMTPITPAQHAAIVAHFLDGVSIRIIAQRFELPDNAIESVIRAALRELTK